MITTPRSQKNPLWNPYCNFAAPNHEKVTKMTPKWVPRGSQNPPKIDQNADLDPKVSHWKSLGVPRPPKWCPRVPKWCPRAPKWSPQASQMAGLGAQNHSPAVFQSCQSCQSCKSSQSCQSLVNWLLKGPAAGAKP